MLKINPIQSNEQKLSRIDQLNRDQETYVVSDLKSKFEIQKRLLNKSPLLEEFAVLRASELWGKWCTKIHPEIQWVSKDLLLGYFREKLSAYDQKWLNAPGSAQRLLDYISSFLPLLIHGQANEQLANWFREHPQSYVTWGHWYEVAREFWDDLNQKNWALMEWAPCFLLQSEDPTDFWDRSLVFDLGPQLTPIEAELISRMGTHDSAVIEVMQPSGEWSDSYDTTMWPYKLLNEEGFKFDSLAGRFSFEHLKNSSERVSYKRFSTRIAEVKDAVSQVREWIDSGVAMEKIAIVSTDLETYWPALSSHLMVEGIPFQKKRVTRLHSFNDINRWMARLRLSLGQHNPADLESRWYQFEETPKWSYDQFKRLFTNLLDEQDLKRSFDAFNDFNKNKFTVESTDRNTFMGLALSTYQAGPSTDNVESLLNRFFSETPPGLIMSVKNWVNYLERLATKIEVFVDKGHSLGINCENVSSIDYLECEKVYFVGVTESNLIQQTDVGVSAPEVISISQNLGFHLNPPEKSLNELYLQYLLQQPELELILSMPMTDFSGSVESPSKLWIAGAMMAGRDLEQIDSPGTTVLDSKMSVRAGSLPERSPENFDMGLEHRELSPVEPGKVRLSVSQLESYLQCPFKFMAQKVFKLANWPELDLDIDHMTGGRVMHALLEKILVADFESKWSEDSLVSVVEQCLKDSDITDSFQIKNLTPKYIDLAKKFLAFEAQWHRDFPKTKNVAKESELKGFWNLEKGELDPDSGEFPFLGYVDRLDGDGEGRLGVIDYKSSMGSVKNHKSWLSNNMLQMALYTEAIEKGLCADGKGDVVFANYYVPKMLERNKGYVLDGRADQLVDEPSRFLKISGEEKQKLLDSSNELVQEAAKNIASGKLQPQPEDFKICDSCDWRTICRSEHLM